MPNVPAVANYGKIIGYFTEALADSIADAGEVPDQIPLTGRIELVASPKHIIFAGLVEPQTTKIKTITLDLVDGYVVPPGATDSTVKGVSILAKDQPDGSPTVVNWTAKFSGGLAGLKDLPLDIPTNGVVDLSTVLPAEPEPGTIQVMVNAASKQDVATLDQDMANHISTANSASQQAVIALAGGGGGTGTGADGPAIELQTSATHIQWRVVGDVDWINLISLAELTGEPGNPGDPGDPGPAVELQTSATHIQWRVVGTVPWNDLVALTALKGDPGDPGDPGVPGPAIEMQATATHIQWRVVGDANWINLVDLEYIKGDPGDPGDDAVLPANLVLSDSVNEILPKTRTEFDLLTPDPNILYLVDETL